MANINAPKGFIPIRHLDGAAYNGQFQTFLVLAADATAIFVGDVVQFASASGTAGVVVNGMDCEGMPTVTKPTGTVTAGTSIAGVVRGFLPDPTALATKHRPASVARIALVVTDPTVVYEVQEDAVTTPLAAVDIGLNTSFSAGTGSATTGVSTAQIVSASKATTSTLPIRIMGLVKRPDNAFNTAGAGSDNAKFEVIFNASGFSFGGAGIAGTA